MFLYSRKKPSPSAFHIARGLAGGEQDANQIKPGIHLSLLTERARGSCIASLIVMGRWYKGLAIIVFRDRPGKWHYQKCQQTIICHTGMLESR